MEQLLGKEKLECVVTFKPTSSFSNLFYLHVCKAFQV